MKKVILILLCLLMVTVISFGQLNDFELPVESVHLLSVEGQEVTTSDNVLAISAIEVIGYLRPVAVPTPDTLNYNLLSIVDYMLKGSQEYSTNNIQRITRDGLGGIAVRLKYPLYSTI